MRPHGLRTGGIVLTNDNCRVTALQAQSLSNVGLAVQTIQLDLRDRVQAAFAYESGLITPGATEA